MGRQQAPGAQRLARLTRTPEPEPADLEPVDREPDDFEPDDLEPDDATERWGATAMPDWLDTRRGRRAWADRDGDDFDCLADADASDDEDDQWVAPRRRWTMLPPAAIGLIAVGVIACAVAGYSLLRGNEPVAPLVAFDQSEAVSAPAVSAPAAPPSTRTPAQIVVSVVGLVHRPGLVRMPVDSRVADALAEAGGARPDADTLSLNLAQVLRDGDQILVGRKGPGQVRSAVVGPGGSGAAPSTGTATPGASGQKVDLNTATEAELDALPGVGPVTAQAILAWRQANGSFASVDQLAEVDGIGEGRLAKLRPLVTVGG